MNIRSIYLIVCMALLVACGGGGGDSSSTLPPRINRDFTLTPNIEEVPYVHNHDQKNQS